MMGIPLTEFIETKTVRAIYAAHEARNRGDGFRDHLGASVLGEECERKLWYGWRWCTPVEFDGRMLRLFQTGQLAEGRFTFELRAIGAEVYEIDPNTGRQFSLTAPGLGGHVGGSLDGCATGIPDAPKTMHLLEYKTHNDRSFTKLKAEGVEKAKPLHYVQQQMYMGWSDGGMERSLYLAVNKNTDELYGERVYFDQSSYDKAMAKAGRVIRAAEPPPKIAPKATDFRCKFCDHFDACWGTRVPLVHCRTCVHATPVLNGKPGEWRCAWHDNDVLTPAAQRAGCDAHLFIPPLLANIAAPVDAGHGFVVYRRKDGRHFINCAAGVYPPAEIAERYANGSVPPMLYTSKEIKAAKDPAFIGSPEADAIKAKFGTDSKVTG